MYSVGFGQNKIIGSSSSVVLVRKVKRHIKKSHRFGNLHACRQVKKKNILGQWAFDL